jgi:uncharacterized protein (TIGR02646 family)
LLFFEKSQPAPECLAYEKGKASGDYKCGDVLQRLHDDFKNKCYICESKAPTSINVEHFRPHKDDRDLMFDWNNLYWACAHCNNIKGAKYTDILSCTDPGDQIGSKLRYTCDSFPDAIVNIGTLDDDSRTQSTKELVLAVFNGTTVLKKMEAANLRKNLEEEIKRFFNRIEDYLDSNCSDNDKEYLYRWIKSQLNEASAFTSFKRWIIRENDRLKQEFHDCI